MTEVLRVIRVSSSGLAVYICTFLIFFNFICWYGDISLDLLIHIYIEKSFKCASSSFLELNVHPSPRSVSSALTSKILLSYVITDAVDLDEALRIAPIAMMETGPRFRPNSSASKEEASRTRGVSAETGRLGKSGDMIELDLLCIVGAIAGYVSMRCG